MPKPALAASVAGDGLEHQVQWHAAVDRFDRGGDVGQHAGLGGDVVALDDGVEHFQQGADRSDAVGGRVDADHGVAVAVQQAVENAGGNTGRFVCRVVGLQPGRQAPAQAHGAAEPGDHADFLRHQHQVLHAHDLRHGSGHFRGQPGRQGAQAVFVGFLAQQPVTQATHGQVADRGEGLGIVGVDDQAGHFICFVRDQCFIEKVRQRNVGQRHLRGDALGVVAGRHACQAVPGACRAGLGHHFLEAVEAVDQMADRVYETCHTESPEPRVAPRRVAAISAGPLRPSGSRRIPLPVCPQPSGGGCRKQSRQLIPHRSLQRQ